MACGLGNLCIRSTRVMDYLVTQAQANGGHVKINNANGSYMPVCVEILRPVEHDERWIVNHERQVGIVSVAHYYLQNGDLMADPDVEFFFSPCPDSEHGTQNVYYPASQKQDGLPAPFGGFHEYLRYDGNRLVANQHMQRDLTRFCDSWMGNIQEQQSINIDFTPPKKPTQQYTVTLMYEDYDFKDAAEDKTKREPIVIDTISLEATSDRGAKTTASRKIKSRADWQDFERTYYTANNRQHRRVMMATLKTPTGRIYYTGTYYKNWI